MTPRGPRLVWAAVPIAGVTAAVGASFDRDLVGWLVGLPLAVACAFVGALITDRRRGNRVGALLTVFGLQLAVSMLALGMASTGSPLATSAAWVEAVVWTLGFVLLVVVLPLIFPDGKVPAGWPRRVPGVLVTAWALFVLGNSLHPDLLRARGMANPTAVPSLVPILEPAAALGAALFAGCALAAVVVAVQRYRRSVGVVRQQHRWFAASAAVLLVAVAGMAIAFESDREALAFASFGLGALTVPVAVGVAITRHRLYDIDRLISRTVTYGAVTLVLAGCYALAVLSLGSLVGRANDLAVAASTLLVAALFGPLRRRVQAGVDRRFNRARYDAQRTVETFRDRLRADVHLDEVAEHLLAAVGGTVQPVQASLWLRGDRR